MTQLSDMKNIGSTLASKMTEAGIENSDDLISLGAKKAFIKVKSVYPDACINHLYAVAGAIEGIRWHNLSNETKLDLKDFYNEFK